MSAQQPQVDTETTPFDAVGLDAVVGFDAVLDTVAELDGPLLRRVPAQAP